MANKLQKKLDRASFRYEDVDLCLNGDLASKREELRENIADKREALSGRMAKTSPEIQAMEAELAEVEAGMREDLFTLRFRSLPGDKWKALVAANPPAKGNLIDQNKGYNVGAVVREAAEGFGHYVDPDDGTTEPVDAEQWQTIWGNISPGDLDRVQTTVLLLNENYGWQGVDFLKKG